MTIRAASAVAVLLLVVIAAACSSYSAELCESAAFAQADAEERWTELLEEHAYADAALNDDPTSEEALAAHNDSADRLLGARVTMIVAEAKTRARCG